MIPWLAEEMKEAHLWKDTPDMVQISSARLLALIAIAKAAETWMDQVGFQSDLQKALEAAERVE